MGSQVARRILVIRRDNIGDLLCTTPLLSALRRRYANAWIGVLANSYSAPALTGNGDIDVVYVYDKGKHLDSLGERLRALWHRFALVVELRQQRFDVILLPAGRPQSSAERFARFIDGSKVVRSTDRPLRPHAHEVESAFRCAEALGIEGPPPAMALIPDADEVAIAARAIPPGSGPLIGLHISARKKSQRWPVARFAAMAQHLHATCGARFLLFWAPGSAHDARHPGDDERADELAAAMADTPFARIPTTRLSHLIAGLSLCERVVCSDGGAMHVAAALGKPLVCFFGNSDAERWYPWGVPHVLLQKDDREVASISVDEALAALEHLDNLSGPRPN